MYKSKRHLIDSILKNKVYLDNTHTFGVNHSSTIERDCFNSSFNTLKHVDHIRKTFFLLKSLRVNKKPILFFGINDLGLEAQSNKAKILAINKEIFSLCFTSIEMKDKEFIILMKQFYELYSKDPFSNVVLKNFALKQKLHLNGYFLNHWGSGSLSNFHYLKPSLDKFSNLLGGESKKDLFVEKYKTLGPLGASFNCPSELPGAAVFFSKSGYGNFFKEFKNLGVPVVCIVNNRDSLEGIDYPLFGDDSSLKVISFYKKMVESALKSTDPVHVVDKLKERQNTNYA